MAFQKGDRVYVVDAGLEKLRELMTRLSGVPAPPNHFGTVESLLDDGEVLIYFDDEVSAPYPASLVHFIEEEGLVE